MNDLGAPNFRKPLYIYNIPVVLDKAVAQRSKIGTRGELL